MDRRPRVALVIESSRAYGRGLLRGIADYARSHGPWSVYHTEWTLADAAPSWLSSWKGDGAIIRAENKSMLKLLSTLKVPVVELRGRYDLGMPMIVVDDEKVTRLAIDHLLDRGFEHLAFCGFPGTDYSDCRQGYFTRFVNEAGLEPHIYHPPRRSTKIGTMELEAEGLIYEESVAHWITTLPKPIGVMACNDIRGQQVLNACREVGVAVPDQVAVIGVDNDELLCDLSDPPLTSVELNTEKIGYEGAALLDRLMHGRKPGTSRSYVEPLGVVTRQSTDVLAIDDPQISSAVRFIREHACEGIGVEDVLDHVLLSRSTLERRFESLLKRSPKSEIIRVKIQRVKQLLSETDYPLSKIAELSGFRHAEYLSVAFKQRTGVTPGEYRQQVRTQQPRRRWQQV